MVTTNSHAIRSPIQSKDNEATTMMSVEDANSSPTSPAPPSCATSPTPSLTYYFCKHLRSPRSFRHASRNLSTSPLAIARSLPLSNLDNNTTTVNGTMTTPVSSTQTPARKAYLPLSVRTSSLYPFDFDPVKTMEDVETRALALPSPSTKTVRYNNNHDCLSHGVSPTTSRSSSDAVPLDEKISPESESTITLRESEFDESHPATNSMCMTTPPIPNRDNLLMLKTDNTSAPTVTPSKNNLANLLREMQAKREDHNAKSRTASIVSQSTTIITTPQHHGNSVSMTTPKSSSREKASPKGSLMGLLSPRSTKTIRSFSAAELFGTRTASTITTPPDESDEVVGDLEFLCSQPPPDLDQHPLMTVDPFTSRSIAPSMSTQMNATQTRQWTLDSYRQKKDRWAEKKLRPFVKGGPFPIFKQPEWIVKEEDRVARQVAEATRKTSQWGNQGLLASEASPTLKSNKIPKTPLRIDTKAANSPTSDIHVASKTATPLTDDIPKKSGSASIRNFSNLFRSRLNTDRCSLMSSTQQANIPEDKREEPRARKGRAANFPLPETDSLQERYLRTITNCPSFDYNPTSAYPRHPNTGRDWRSRNLRCAGCQWVTCTACGRACCARAACFYAMENHKENPAGMGRAQEIKEMIECIVPTDREVQTFLTCTSCKTDVCPDCCGMCPHDACQDIQCRHCKRGDPWDECDWHKDLIIVRREKKAVRSTANTI